MNLLRAIMARVFMASSVMLLVADIFLGSGPGVRTAEAGCSFCGGGCNAKAFPRCGSKICTGTYCTLPYGRPCACARTAKSSCAC
jgi:hypothetical protein